MATAATKPFAWAFALASSARARLCGRLRLGLSLSYGGGAFARFFFGFFARLRGQ